MKSRLNLPTLERMNAAQRVIFSEIMETRGNAQGPFLAWLLSPGFAQPAQALGAFCRYNSSLSLEESELLILYVAAYYQCIGEQQIHEPIARAAGLSSDALIAIRTGDAPPLATPRLRLLSECAKRLLEKNRLDSELYSRAAEIFGEKALVEIVGVIGYYAMVAYTLNAFEMSLD
ncbi:MAG: carboxymuconolactone decarboxylase family protein [Variovorax sp.]|nr:MAG: carboxymuconolactone decarboxylase family protein [Variovorax sp.]